MTSTSFRPRDGEALATVTDSSSQEVAEAVERAAQASTTLDESSPAERRSWLHGLAAALMEHVDQLAELADTETALGLSRLTNEVIRTADQLRFYGDVAVEGSYLQLAIDEATATSPRIVRVNRPVGPVGIFGASNFPFAFGILGNDTGSAIAAGCPVVCKAHPAHLQTCIRLAQISEDALARLGAPDGTLSMVTGMQAGVELVQSDPISAIAFTGSQQGGMNFWRIANERQNVIPVYAEMGTVNPVIMTRSAVQRLDQIVGGFVHSFTLGSGQFCTKPGMMFVPAGYGVAKLVAQELVRSHHSATMLTSAMAESVTRGIEELTAAGASIVGRSPGPGSGWSADAVVLSAPIEALVPGSRLLEECFGPVALVIEYGSQEELSRGLEALQGSLTASVMTAGSDDPSTADLVKALAHRAGRVTVDDWPTGVAWTWAQHHGGPWPATSAPASTSVGAAALGRFVRPVAFQSVPSHALPTPVRIAASASNPWRLPRRMSGSLMPS